MRPATAVVAAWAGAGAAQAPAPIGATSVNIFTTARMAVRVVGLAMLILGVVTWTGGAGGLVPVHVILGIGLVLALWTVAVVARKSGVRPVLATMANGWGVLLVVFGMTQAEILPGNDLHLAIRVIHLFAGLAAVGLAETLGAAVSGAGTPTAR